MFALLRRRYFLPFLAFLADFFAAFLAFFAAFLVAICEPPLWRRALLPAAHSLNYSVKEPVCPQLQPDVEPQLLHL
jgi:hypothetical protein